MATTESIAVPRAGSTIEISKSEDGRLAKKNAITSKRTNAVANLIQDDNDEISFKILQLERLGQSIDHRISSIRIRIDHIIHVAQITR